MRLRLFKGAMLIAAVGALAVVGLGELLGLPAHTRVGDAPADLGASSLRLPLSDGSTIGAWYSPGRDGHGVVLVLHGIRASRLEMVERMRFLHRAGFGVLAIDLPAHGESDGDHIEFGKADVQAVRTALGWIGRTTPDERIGVIAISLGAAVFVMAQPDPMPQAVVLESMFPTLRASLDNRLRRFVGPASGPLTTALLGWMKVRTGRSAEDVQPIALVSRLHAPLLIASGAVDTSTTAEETRQLYAAAAEPKTLWLVDGAGHVDLHAHAQAQYEQRIGAFLGDRLGR